MKRQNIFICLILLFFAASVFVSCKQSSAGPAQDISISKIAKKMAAVKFSHDRHDDGQIKCTACHHKSDNDDRIKICSKCHLGDDGKEIIHGLCIECHKEKKKGPTSCDSCHK